MNCMSHMCMTCECTYVPAATQLLFIIAKPNCLAVDGLYDHAEMPC